MTWDYIWKLIKRDTWYFFRPFKSVRDAHRFFRSGNLEDCDYYYNKRENKGKK